MSHYTEDELELYSIDPAATPDRAALESHLDECEQCRGLLAFIEKIDAALREKLPWILSEEFRNQPTRPAPDELFRLAETIDRERAEARALLPPLLQSPLAFRRAALEKQTALHTSGLVQVLSDTASGLHERQPQFALALADTAISIALTLARRGALRSLGALGVAWKERANALRLLGRFKDADEALTRAEEAFRKDPGTTAHDLATVWFGRATVYMKSERLQEAGELAAAAARNFLEFGDTARYLNALLVRGSVLYLRGDHAAAASVFEEIAAKARERRDRALLARALQNAAASYAEIRQYAQARRYDIEALAIYDELGLETEKVRTGWTLGSIAVAAGDLDEGIRQLDRARGEFEALGLTNDAALARLEMGEALLLADRPEELRELLRDVVMHFTSEGMMRNARIAIAHLHEALAANRVTPELVRQVRVYLERLPANPNAPFDVVQ
jgi:tetratricopeptide (TPR) repeat protein